MSPAEAREQIQELDGWKLNEENPDITLWAGVACYPAHAFDVGALIERANGALESAREWHQDRIEVATAD